MLDEKILSLLKKVIYPNFQKDIVSFGFVKEAKDENGKVSVVVRIPSSVPEVAQKLESEIKEALSPLNAKEYHLSIEQPEIQKQEPAKTQAKNLAPHIKSFVMVSSGKGGVGKSTTSVNLAIALAQQGKRVGLLDADIYGPNIPRMLKLNKQRPEVDSSGKRLQPLVAYGIEMMSMGVLYEENQSLIWRGPMIMRAIDQMLRDVAWSELDVLVIDMPPGTGDAQLTLAQSVPVTAGITVSTPQKVSLDDSTRSLDMFRKLKIPIAGIIENMSGFICPDNGKEYDIFGKGTTKAIADDFQTELLAQIPIELIVREGGDEGKPVVFFHPESKSAKEYLSAASKLWEFIEEALKYKKADNSTIQPVPSQTSACSS
ncbi:sodium:proton antiporter [Helicobacter monodelphidis]|uniref:Mrp/NBP35 family ATP-binding protein n=1 Tax=Helicobacter sp. 15-1451 TaxID=2004995 RepID=UPI000DCD9570|nr:Mrp/NBP35 family ATP-binding protein [Helicobacter sp. 15-1451]RAX57583.1 sodium:proton antiporter [Helicobacter sp. 15-1451]